MGQFISSLNQVPPLDRVGGDGLLPRWNNATQQWDMVDVYTQAEADAAIAAAVGDIDLSAYAKLDGSNQPFTGDVVIDATHKLTTEEVKAAGATLYIRASNGNGFRVVDNGTYNELAGDRAFSHLGSNSTLIRFGTGPHFLSAQDLIRLGSGGVIGWASTADPINSGNNVQFSRTADKTVALADGSGGAADLVVTGNLAVGGTSVTSLGGLITVTDVAGESGGGTVWRRSDGLVKGTAYTYDGLYISTLTNHPIVFSPNNVEKMRLDTSGNLAVTGDGTFDRALIGGVIDDGTSALQIAGDMRIVGGGGGGGIVNATEVQSNAFVAVGSPGATTTFATGDSRVATVVAGIITDVS